MTQIVLFWKFSLNIAKPQQISWGIKPLHHSALTDKVMSLVTKVSQLILCRVLSGQLCLCAPPPTFWCCLEMTIYVREENIFAAQWIFHPQNNFFKLLPVLCKQIISPGPGLTSDRGVPWRIRCHHYPAPARDVRARLLWCFNKPVAGAGPAHGGQLLLPLSELTLSGVRHCQHSAVPRKLSLVITAPESHRVLFMCCSHFKCLEVG